MNAVSSLVNFSVGLESSAVEAGFKAHAVRGTGRYVTELLKYFGDQSDQRIEVRPFSQHALFSQSVPARLTEFLPFGKQTIRQQLFYPFWLMGRATSSMDILHFPVHIDAPSWTPKEYMVTVLDLIPVILSELYAPKKNSWRFRLARWLELQAIRNAKHILTISQHTADDVHRVLGVPYEKMTVTPLGVSKAFFEIERQAHASVFHKFDLDPSSPVILYVGGIDQRKNIEGLLRIFSEVVRRRRGRNAVLPQLVLAGNIASDAQYPLVQQWIRDYGVADQVKELGYVEDEDLYLLYGGAALFLFPSLYEGFGLTPLEAMAAGTPVVSSNTSAMPEVLGDAALLFSPDDIEQAVSSVIDILDNDPLAHRLSEDGRKQAGSYTWEQTGQKTLQAYEVMAQC